MLLILLSWLYMGLLLYTLGHYGQIFLSSFFKTSNDDVWWQKIIGGICYLSLIVTILSVFMPIAMWANVIVMTLAGGCYCWRPFALKDIIKPFKNFDTLSWLIFLGVLALCLIESTDWGDMHDESLYYQPSIRWIQSYKAIPGLANLHGKLGFGSTWFVLSAFFNFSFLGFDFLNDLNGFVFLVVSVCSIGSIRNIYQNKSVQLSDMVVPMIPFALIWLYLKHISSSNVDLPTCIMIWLIFNELLKKYENGTLLRFDTTWVVISLISCFIVTAKLSQLTILILLVFPTIILLYRRQYISLGKLILFCSLIIMPWLVRNVIHTGYIIYPLATIDLFDFDWEVPKVDYPNATGCCQSVKAEKDIVLFHSRGLLEGPAEEKLQLPMSYWLPQWLKTITKLDIAVLLLYLGSLVLLGFYVVTKTLKGFKNNKELTAYFSLVMIVCITGIVLWYLNGPSMRYAYSFFCYPTFLVAALLFTRIVKEINISFRSLGLCIGLGTLFSFAYPIIYTESSPVTMLKHLYKPVPFYYPEKSFVYIDGDSTKIVYLPFDFDGRCGFTDVPCGRYLGPNFNYRGKKIEDGFKNETYPTGREYHTQRELDIKRINIALQKYKNDKGVYPLSSELKCITENDKNWIPELVPDYLKELPRDPRNNFNYNDQYFYKSNGTDYKIISHTPPDIDFIKQHYRFMIDSVARPTWAYGFWTAGAEKW